MNSGNLKTISKQIRKSVLEIANSSKGPHVGSALSCVDILSVLYFSVLRLEPFDANRDIFILSKGHGAMALYATLFNKGLLCEEEFFSYYQNGGVLPAHLDRQTSKYIEVSSGSLGHGLPQALGFAYSKKIKQNSGSVFVVMGDGEMQEGSVWEAIMLAPKMELDNLVVLIDRNDLQGYGKPSELVSFEPLEEKFASFNWDVDRINGHDHQAVFNSLMQPRSKPKAIICDTIKGKGVPFMENELKWHYFIVTDELLQKALESME